MGAFAAGSAGLVSAKGFAATLRGEQQILLSEALAALNKHGDSIPHRDRIGIVNFAAHSRVPRLQIIDLPSRRVLKSMLVAHGNGSDPGNTGWVQRFSNRPGSNASSPGSFVTGDTYYGKHGKSRRLHGLDPENSLAAQRAIVIHGARYVTDQRAEQLGRIGRSQGCFAVSERDIGDLLDLLGPGRLLYASR